MKPFRLLVDLEVIDFINTLPRTQRVKLRDSLLAIQQHPAHSSDYEERDAEGRTVAIHISGKFAIKFWVDHADKHIKVLDIHSAD
jgi:mRNA-degrading endonuclease RelE of RelBE toxin-antitoxin system